MDPRRMMKLKASLAQFNNNHPKLLPFLQSLEKDGLAAGSVIEMRVTTPEGRTKTANIKVKESDLELLRSLKQ